MGHICRISVDTESERKNNKHRKEKNKKGSILTANKH